MLLTFTTHPFAQTNTEHERVAAALVAAPDAAAREAVLAREKAQLTVELRKALITTGDRHRTRGEFAQALAAYESAQAVSERIGDEAGVAIAINNTGVVYNLQSNYGRAMELFLKSLALKEKIGDKIEISRTLNNIGIVHFTQGNYPLALDFYRRGLALRESAGDRTGVSASLGNIGNVHLITGDYALALEFYRKSLALKEELGDRGGVALTLNNVGVVHRLRREYEQALQFFDRSLAMRESLGDRLGVAQTLYNLALTNYRLGRFEAAADYAARSGVLARDLNIRESYANARSLEGAAQLNLNRLDEARRALEDAVAGTEEGRAVVAGGEVARQRYFEDRVSPYQRMVQLLVVRGRAGEALAYAERAKARVLLEVLRDGRAQVGKAMTAPEREREQRLQQSISTLNSQVSEESLRGKGGPARLEELKTQLQKARLDYDAFRADLYAAHPELRVRRGEVHPFTLADAEGLLPDARTALLEYVVGEEKTHLFVLTKGNAAPVDLAVYELNIGRKDLDARASGFREQLASRALGFRGPARELYELLLKPAQTNLKGRSRLVVVPDAGLWELPFQALITGQGKFLIEQAEVSYGQSLTVLREMSKPRARPSASRSQLALLAFGNPSGGAALTAAPARGTLLSAPSALPEAERQVRALEGLYRPQRSAVYTGAAAREDRLKAEAATARVLHLATHGVLDDAQPLASHVILSKGEGAGGDDGMLEARELMQMELHADLVVLSACETARGRVGAGEGVLGLTWALFVAGSPTTVVSQWKVEESSTTELMVEFHRLYREKLMNARTAVSTAGALRSAALALSRKERYAHPFYWAGFVVVGDGR
ncbi:MAG TPA: CHAT domain-containing tetratricopeptide repeat protein [Pyrinomonadaceae bacterium]